MTTSDVIGQSLPRYWYGMVEPTAYAPPSLLNVKASWDAEILNLGILSGQRSRPELSHSSCVTSLNAIMASISECLSVFCWCLPCFALPEADEDRDPLLPHYNDDTALQRGLHQKLHTYQMLRALSQGFMPSNEQAIVNLRTMLAADILSPDDEELSDSGRALVHYVKVWLKQFMDLLQHKNRHDQIQDFIWYLTKARVSVDVEDIVHRASKAKSKAQTAAGERRHAIRLPKYIRIG